MSEKNLFLRIAKITGAHGLHGRLRIIVISDIIERFNPGTTLYLKIDSEYKEFKILEFIEQKGRTSLIKLEGIENRDDALLIKGIEVFISKREAESSRENLGKDEYYYYDLIGCKAYWNNEYFADVKDIKEIGGGNILILIDSKGKEHMIPFIESMVDTSSIVESRIDINPVDGLFE